MKKLLVYYPSLIKILFVCLLYNFTCSTSFFGQQNVNADIQRINLAMFDADKLKLELSYQFFFGNKLHTELKGTIIKDNNKLYQKIGSITIIKNEPYCLFVDDERKIMVLDPYYAEGGMSRDDILSLNVDSLKNFILSTEMQNEGDRREYLFTLKKGRYSRISFDFNIRTFLLRNIQLYQREDYRDQNGDVHRVKSIIRFDKIDVTPIVRDSDFDLSNFVSIDHKRKKAVAVRKYQSYRFNSNIDKSIEFN